MNAPITIGVEHVADEDFVIDDEEKAAWAVSVIRARRRHCMDLEGQHAVRLQKAARELEHAEAFLGPQLEQWARSELKRKRGNDKHVDVATGRLQFRHRAGGIRITDEKAIAAFAANVPGAFRDQVTKILVMETLKKAIAERWFNDMRAKLAELAEQGVDGGEAFGRASEYADGNLPRGSANEPIGETFSVIDGGDTK